MADFSPIIDCCEPAFVLTATERGWLHDSSCELNPGGKVVIEHGRCPFHPSEELDTCRGCLHTYDATHEDLREMSESW